MQQLHVMVSNSVAMLVVDFIENTLAPGCVVIITDNVVEYVYVGYLSDGNHTDTLTISGLSKDRHIIAAYDLETRTTPGRYMAANESVDPNTERVSSSSGVEFEGGGFYCMVLGSSLLMNISFFLSCQVGRESDQAQR